MGGQRVYEVNYVVWGADDEFIGKETCQVTVGPLNDKPYTTFADIPKIIAMNHYYFKDRRVELKPENVEITSAVLVEIK